MYSKHSPRPQFEQDTSGALSRALPNVVQGVASAHDVDDVGCSMLEYMLFSGEKVVVVARQRRDIVVELKTAFIVQDGCR